MREGRREERGVMEGGMERGRERMEGGGEREEGRERKHWLLMFGFIL